MSIWFQPVTLEQVRRFGVSMPTHIGIEFTEIGEDFIRGRMPVDDRTRQPFGILHGGASCVLSESLGSIAAWMTIDPDKHRAVGFEINANHIRAVTQGAVIGTCTPMHVGKRTQVWQTDITEEGSGKRVAISRLTVAIIDHGKILALDTPANLKRSVGAATIVTVVAEGDMTLLAKVLLEHVPGAVQADPHEQSVELATAGATGILPAVLNVALDAGFALTDVRVAEPTLETVFIRLTGKELRD